MAANNQSKERILAGAKELFLARGYAATTVDAICEKVGLTKGSVYYFFDSKVGFGLRFWIGLFGQACKCWEVALTVPITGPGRDALPFRKHWKRFRPLERRMPTGSFALELADTNSRMQQVRCGHVPGGRGPALPRTFNPSRLSAPGSRARAASELADTLLGPYRGFHHTGQSPSLSSTPHS